MRSRNPLYRYSYSSVGTEGATPPGSPGGTLLGEPATGAPTEGQGAQEQTELTKAQAEVERWKRQARDNEARAKANADAAKRLADIEDSTKSDTERLTSKAAKLEADLGTANNEIVRLQAAIEHGLSGEDLILLPKGLSAEETQTAAKRLAERGNTGGGQQQDPPSFDGGARGSSTGGQSFDETVRRALRNRR